MSSRSKLHRPHGEKDSTLLSRFLARIYRVSRLGGKCDRDSESPPRADRREIKKDIINDMEIVPLGSQTADLEANCPNHHKHSCFTPMSEFNMKVMPTSFRCDEALDYIFSIAPLVVKVTVGVVSPERDWDDKLKDPRIIRQGTGWVNTVTEDNKPRTVECPFVDCKVKDGPHKAVGPFYVMTAKHLVYDKTEAINTTIHFTNDDPDPHSPSDPNNGPPPCKHSPYHSTQNTWVAEGVSVVFPSDSGRDFIYMKCYSHDLDVARHLISASDRVARATKAVQEKELDKSGAKEMMFIISYPHGLPKCISFGSVTSKEEKEVEIDFKTGEKRRGALSYSYEVDTCPGSSGAPVCILGVDEARYYLAPHSSREEGKGQTEGLVDWILD